MGSLPGKITGRQDVWDIKAFRLEEKVKSLESEVRKMRSEIDNYHKEQKSSATPCPSTTNGRGRYSSICEPHSVELIRRRGSAVVFTEALLKAELQRLRGENDTLTSRLGELRQPNGSYIGFEIDRK